MGPRPDPVTQKVESMEEEMVAVKTSIDNLQQNWQKQFMEQMNLMREEFRATMAESLHSFTEPPSGGTPPNGAGPSHLNGGQNWRFRKLDMPLFDGVNPDGWIIRAERYFLFYRLNEIEKLEAVPQSLMPEGLLSGLDDVALRDLFAYLQKP